MQCSRPYPPVLRAGTQAYARRFFATSRSCRAKDAVRIVEVGPRDGLQNEKKSIPVATKIELIDRLNKTGLQTIEAGSFVHPKWVPQFLAICEPWTTSQVAAQSPHRFQVTAEIWMANSSEILQHLLQQSPTNPITYQWLLPNTKGLENYFNTFDAFSTTNGAGAYPTPPPSPSHDSGPATNTSSNDPNAMPSSTSATDSMSSTRTSDPTRSSSSSAPRHEISIFLSATGTFSKKNTNCSISESLERFRPLIKDSLSRSTPVRAYISVALGCPYEGPDVDPHRVAELAASLLEMGADEISVADTTGMGTAPRTAELLRTLEAAGIRKEDLAFHFHDTYGQALVNTVVALEAGIRTFDSAVGGLGGCPFSPGATGNVATEDLVHCLHGLGAETGVDLVKVAEIGEWINGEIGKVNESRAGKATLAKLRAG